MNRAIAVARSSTAWWEAFYRRYGALMQLVLGAFLVAVAVFLVVIALELRSFRSYGDHLVRAQCERSREFSPQIADFYEAQHALDAKTLGDYRATIPKHC